MSAKKLKIIHTEASHGWGGQEIRILTEANWFRKRGHQIIFILPEQSTLYQKVSKSFQTYVVPFTRNNQLLDLWKAFNIFQKERPDVVATHSSVDSWVGLSGAKLAGIPTKVRYRHVSTPVAQNAFNRFQYRKLCDHIITTGDCIRTPLIDQFSLNPQKVHTIPTGLVPPDKLPDRSVARAALARELGLPPESRFMGQISVLRSWKGHPDLIQSWEKIAPLCPHHHLILVGEGPCYQALLNQASASAFADRIHLIGHRKDVYPYFRAFDVAILASFKNEGIPQSGLQAMYAETPLVGTQVGGIPEIIGDQVTGFLIEPRQPEALAEAVIRCLKHPDRKKIIQRAKEQVLNKGLANTMGSAVYGVFIGSLTART